MNKEYKFLNSSKLYDKKNMPKLLIGKMMNYYNGRIEGKRIKQEVDDFLKEYNYGSK